MAKKIKLTRKQMKQPDEFLSWSEQLFEWAEQNVYYLIGGVAGVLVLFLLIQGISYMVQGRTSRPQVMLGDALELSRSPILGPNQAPPLGLSHYYASLPERLQATIKALTELNDQYGSSNEGQLALLYLGENWEQMQDYPKAGEYYTKFLATSVAKKNDYLRLGATLGLGRALYEQNKLDEALAKFDEVIQAGGTYKDDALIAAARAQFVKGDKAKAGELLAQAEKEFPASFATQPAKFLLAYWEKNPPKPGEAKPLQIPAPGAAGLDLGASPLMGGTGASSAPGATTIMIPANGGTVVIPGATPAAGATTLKPAVGGTAPNALPAPVPPPETPAPTTPAPVTPAPPKPASPTPPAGENPAPKPAQP